MNILALHTGLFPDADAVGAALAALEGAHEVARMDLTRPGMGDGAWDAVLAAILVADLIITN